jgi:carbamoylphosphate synthase large subunit
MCKRILVPSAGGPGCVNLVRSLRRLPEQVFLVGMDASPHYLHLALTDVSLVGPRRDDEDAYVDFINDVCREFDIDMIFPNNSLDGAVLARFQGRLAARTFLPSPEMFKVGEDKWLTWQLLSQAGLPVPRTWLLETPDDLATVFAEVEPPVWVRGAGIPGRGVGVASLPARTLEQAIQWVEYWSGWGAMSASEYLPGDNLTWLSVWDRGRLVASQGRQRLAYVIPHVSPSGITGAPAISHTVHNEEINVLGPAVCKAISKDFHGPAFVDFKSDADGHPRITEINVGRFGTTHHFYTEAGAGFPELVVRLAFGEAMPEWVSRFNVLPPDLYWIRTLDAGPVLVSKDRLEQTISSGRVPD